MLLYDINTFWHHLWFGQKDFDALNEWQWLVNSTASSQQQGPGFEPQLDWGPSYVHFTDAFPDGKDFVLI